MNQQMDRSYANKNVLNYYYYFLLGLLFCVFIFVGDSWSFKIYISIFSPYF